MSSPIIWGPSGSKFIGTPQGTNGTVLTNDGTGNLSWSTPGTNPAVTFPIVNNTSTFTDITGFLVDPTTYIGFVADAALVRRYDNINNLEAVDTAFYTAVGGTDGAVQDVAVQTDNKVIIAGAFTTVGANGRSFIDRVNQDGTDDTAFTTNLGTGFNSTIQALAIQTDGKILAGGGFNLFNGNTRNGLVRLNSDGTEDTTFDTNLGTGFNGGVFGIAVQPDDKILVVGTFSQLNGSVRQRIVRLNSDGTDDVTFYATLAPGANSDVYKVRLMSTGDIIVGGAFTTFSGVSSNSIAKISTSGVLDTTFNSNIGNGYGNAAFDVLVQPDDKILVGGAFTTFNGNTRDYVNRLNNDGTEDTTFYTNFATTLDAAVRTFSYNTYSSLIFMGGDFTTPTNSILAVELDGTLNNTFNAFLTSINSSVYAISFNPTVGTVQIGGNFTVFNGNTSNFFTQLGTLSNVSYASQGSIRGVFDSLSGSWIIDDNDAIGTNTGVNIQMTDLGQLQYTSTNMGGTEITSELRFMLRKL